MATDKPVKGKPARERVSRAARVCVICGKPESLDYAPFCSKRCADIDLHRWLGGSYIVPGTAGDDDETPSAPPRGDEQ
jgi:endogenous inhibitor of DNA gyrase (YacG/DUF329 family)